MNWLIIILSIPAGILAGLIYFGGLWWTVKYLTRRTHPYIMVISSYLIRTGLTLIIFYELIRLDITGFFVALLAFLMTRQQMIARNQSLIHLSEPSNHGN